MDEIMPTRLEQENFWNDWNMAQRTRGLDDFMVRQLLEALKWVRSLNLPKPRVLEIGCGTGWLGGELNRECGAIVTGVDLSPLAIEQARASYPNLEFIHGDVLELAMDRAFDVVVTADAIAHIPDQQRAIDFVARVLAPRGLLILMTQNAFVWSRSSYLKPRHPGQHRDWPTLRRIRRLLSDDFSILWVSSLVPGGDRGVLRIVNSRYFSGVLGRIFGRRRVDQFKERLLIGRELVIIARRMNGKVPDRISPSHA
jgi:SAM-dependent methyltransferase